MGELESGAAEGPETLDGGLTQTSCSGGGGGGGGCVQEPGLCVLPGCWGSESPRLRSPALGRSSGPGRRLQGPPRVPVGGGHRGGGSSGVWMLETKQEESAAGSPVGAAPDSDDRLLGSSVRAAKQQPL